MLDLFSGLCGWSHPWKLRGHEVFTVDWDPKFRPDLCKDFAQVTVSDLPWRRGGVDVILASPPCDTFSIAARMPHYRGSEALSMRGAKAIRLVERTLALIDYFQPSVWVIENPRGNLRKMPVMQGLHRETVTMCQYGKNHQKPTDLWGKFPPSLKLKPPCEPGAPCHLATPRGTYRHGVLSEPNRPLRAKIPEGLSRAFLDACERDLDPSPVHLGPQGY